MTVLILSFHLLLCLPSELVEEVSSPKFCMFSLSLPYQPNTQAIIASFISHQLSLETREYNSEGEREQVLFLLEIIYVGLYVTLFLSCVLLFYTIQSYLSNIRHMHPDWFPESHLAFRGFRQYGDGQCFWTHCTTFIALCILFQQILYFRNFTVLEKCKCKVLSSAIPLTPSPLTII